MNITVIGHLCLDVIHHPDGSETESYGGIFYSVATLANLLGESDCITPVVGVGKNEYDAFIERISQYPNIETKGIYKFEGSTNRVHLFYEPTGTRIECSKDISAPIPFQSIKPHLKTDMILVNMVSGFDITLETLDEIRIHIRERSTPIYLDCHSLTLGIKDDNTRFRRPVDTWRRWLFMLHAAQMNEEEAAGLTPDHLDEHDLSKLTLALMTKALFITRGAKGFTLWQEDHKQIFRFDSEPHTKNAIDPTGCGDVFAAAYCAHYLTSGNILASAQFANRVAGWKATQRGALQIDSLSQFRLKEHTIEENAE
jgi:sugar/nucleoside kinase (ribokinase family)